MKIAFLTLYSGYVHRGVETFVKEVGDRLAKKHQVVVFQAGKPTGKEKYRVEQIGLKIDWENAYATGTLRRKFFLDYWSRLIFFFTLRCWPILRKEKFDFVIPTDGGWEKPICWLLKVLSKTKILVTGQSGPGFDDRWNLFWRPDVFVALSSRAKRWAKKVGWGVKVVKIPNGVNLERFNPRIKAKKVNLQPPIILCASALVPSKRIDLTIRAVAQMKNASLLVVGDGDEREKLKKLGKEVLGKRFLLTKAKYEEMPGYYQAADLFTMVSVPWEAFGIVYVEALASGLPVVATDDENRREIIGDSGFFVNPENLEEYTNALEKALKTDFKDKPREQAKQFSWDRIASQYEEIMIK